MPGTTITRTALIIATETALSASPNLTTIERLALRMVAATTERFECSNFGNSETGCPLTQAGIFPRACDQEGRGDDINPFWKLFDRQIERASIGPVSRYVAVVGD